MSSKKSFVGSGISAHRYFFEAGLICKRLSRDISAPRGVPGYLQLMELEPFLRQIGTADVFLLLTSVETMEVLRDLSLIEEGSEPFLRLAA